MATQTSNLNLVLPDYSDKADVGVINDNFKKIDNFSGGGKVEEWLGDIQEKADASLAKISQDANTYLQSLQTEADESLREIENKAKNALDSIPDDYETIYNDVSTIKDTMSDMYRTAYSDVNLIPKDETTPHAYINNEGAVKTISNPSSSSYSFHLSGYIPVESGRTIYLSGNNFLYSQYFAWYDADKVYLGGKTEYGGMAYHLKVAWTVVPENARYLRITFHTEEDADAAWAGYTGTMPTGEVINATTERYVDYHYYPSNPCDFNGDDISVFNKILCIGDSITSGYFNTSTGGQSVAKYSYPAILEKLCGVTCTNMGDAGETSLSWFEKYGAHDFAGHDCAIINFGINDALYNVAESDTRTAIGHIISAIKAVNKGIKIFLATVIPAYSRGNNTYDAINAVIRDIANSTEDCYIVDLALYGHTYGIGYANGHPTACGYRQLASDYKAAISYIVRNNPETFRWIQFIGTDLEH